MCLPAVWAWLRPRLLGAMPAKSRAPRSDAGKARGCYAGRSDAGQPKAPPVKAGVPEVAWG